jgi:hypothetical protein
MSNLHNGSDDTPKDGQHLLAYLIAPEAPGGGFTGALLVTDGRTRPLEFVSAAAVRPSKLQSILYGKSLQEHATIDVIARKLLKSMSFRPELLLVDSEDLLGIAQFVQIPVAVLFEPVGSATGRKSLTRLQYKVAESSRDEINLVGRILGDLEQTVDLLDPFKRTAEALKETLKTRT